MELNLLNINHKEMRKIMKLFLLCSWDWLGDGVGCWLVWSGRGRWESDDGNIDIHNNQTGGSRHCKYTPLLCPGHTHCLIAPLPIIIKITIHACRFRVNICWHLAFNHETLATIFFSYMDIRIGKLSPIKIQTPAKWKAILLSQDD